MNDFLFLIVIENLRPLKADPQERRAWFAVLPVALRVMAMTPVRTMFGVTDEQAPFLVARMVTGTVFLLILAWCCENRTKPGQSKEFLEGSFLLLAWFWLLAPTQNPWYWTWAVALLPFARRRAWLAASGLAMVYYLRFWLSYHRPTSPVPPTCYNGALFFDFVVTWLEFTPWMAWLAAGQFFHRRR